jgi:hypothetical protein
VLVSLVQRQDALTPAQKDLLRALAARAVHNFQRLDEVEWTVSREGASVNVRILIRARSGVYRAGGAARTLPAAAHEALERALAQRRQTKRARVDRRDDHSIKGSGGRRRPQRG